MKIRQVGAELFRVDRQMGNMTKLIVALSWGIPVVCVT